MHDNGFNTSLFVISEFNNLEEIHIGGSPFHGSLKCLENLSKLKKLDISDTNVDSGLEYLPNSINEFHCYTLTNPQAGVGKIYEDLQPFALDVRKGKYDWEKWSSTCRKPIEKNEEVFAQEWLDEKYPKNIRNKHKKLDLCYSGRTTELAGELDLTEFIDLEYLDCSNNKLTSLNLNNLDKLKVVDCSFNELTSLQIDNCRSINILNVKNQPLSGELSIFSHLVNLERLNLIATNFSGSLRPLRTCLNLKILYIAGTNIDSGIEYLPKNIGVVYCNNENITNPSNTCPKVIKIEEQLRPYAINELNGIYNLRNWWKDNMNLVVRAYGHAACSGTPVQEWIDAIYPEEEKDQIIELLISDEQLKKLKGPLELKWFTNLRSFDCSNKQSHNYGEITSLEIIGCPNLKEIFCRENRITRLDVTNCPNLKVLHCSGNLLSELDLKQNKLLEKLVICNNDFTRSDLSFLNHLINLKELQLGNWNEKDVQRGSYNHFHGSLESLKNLTNLKLIDISNTDIDSGLEFLPESVEEICCSNDLRSESRAKKIENKLAEENSGFFLLNHSYMRMINAKNWLNINYPNKGETEMIDLTKWKTYQAGELVIKDYSNLKQIRKERNKVVSGVTKVIISGCLQLKKADISKFEDNQQISINNCPNLKVLDCSGNKLVSLNLVNCNDLVKITCEDNFLTELDLSSLTSGSLEVLSVYNNSFSEQDLSFLSHLTGLKRIEVGNKYYPEKISQGFYNRFVGSLEPLKKLNKLLSLNISNTDIESGLEYLPDSIERVWFSTDQRLEAKVSYLHEELGLYGWKIRAWKEAHPELMIKAWGKKVDNLYNESKVSVIGSVPDQLKERPFSKNQETYELEEKSYQRIILRDKRPFSWETDRPLASKNLPIKLYNIKTNKVEWTKDNPNIKSYATLSYVWGSMRDKSLLEKMKITYQKESKEYEEELIITKWGKKSLAKAIKACKLLKNINYLWIDQFCINQKDREEKGEEVRKMRKCYGESEVTLISINTNANDEVIELLKNLTNRENKLEFATEILKKIVNSQWFTRSWTCQEGWLSRQTIFMFDDVLVDGRVLAQVWLLLQKENRMLDNYYADLNKEPQIFITPIGWSYCKNPHDIESKAVMGLSEILWTVKNRGRNNPIDGIYSVLGLLPYGEKVKPNYKERNHQYTKEELEGALMDVMKVNLKEGKYAEPLTWLGPRRTEPCLWWIPEMGENGSVKSIGAINVYCKPKSVKFTKNGVKLTGSKYRVDQNLKFFGSSQGKLLDYLNIELRDKNSGWGMLRIGTPDYSFLLSGALETIEKIRPGDFMIIPSKSQFVMLYNKLTDFVILVPSEGNFDCSIDILLLTDRKKIIDEKAENLLFIDMVNKKVIEGAENIAQYEAQIQIPPK
jgi:Leucine-rich repeat (LRR) protein